MKSANFECARSIASLLGVFRRSISIALLDTLSLGSELNRLESGAKSIIKSSLTSNVLFNRSLREILRLEIFIGHLIATFMGTRTERDNLNGLTHNYDA